ncbi:hypothetical protein F5X97DRAFT_105087 [Nemania serpens]|nr:hypothetical protein F5X97DRAFT_105087 [Nemania serpens]
MMKGFMIMTPSRACPRKTCSSLCSTSTTRACTVLSPTTDAFRLSRDSVFAQDLSCITTCIILPPYLLNTLIHSVYKYYLRPDSIGVAIITVRASAYIYVCACVCVYVCVYVCARLED